ncbi:MAG TPA: T9SS type A sorting domain-containing protein, partial [Pedobacter sp.]
TSTIINDGDLTNTEVINDNTINFSFQAAGLIWPDAQSNISSVKFYNGTMNNDGGCFISNLVDPSLTVVPRVQFTLDGTTWSDAPGWSISPTYIYDANPNRPGHTGPSSSGQMYTFSGTAIPTCKGIRVIGQVRRDYYIDNYDPWAVYVTEIVALAPPTPMRLMSAPKEAPLFTTSNTKSNKINTPLNKELRITLQNDQHIEEAVAVFKAGSDSLAKEEDAVLFGGTSVTLSTLSSDKVRLTINFMPELSKVKELKLSVNASNTGPVKLGFTDLAAIENYDVLLEDSYLKSTSDVRANPTYDFAIDKTEPASFGNGRFKLIFKPHIRLLNLIANKAAKGAELVWSIDGDLDNGVFELERSDDGVNFTSIGSTAVIPFNSSYAFLDSKPVIGTNYYRLKQVDNAGNLIALSSASLEYLDADNLTFTVYPNPASDIIKVDINKRKTFSVLSINDLQGREVYNKVFSKDQAIEANVSSLATGMYILQLRVESSKEIIGTAKFIKQ